MTAGEVLGDRRIERLTDGRERVSELRDEGVEALFVAGTRLADAGSHVSGRSCRGSTRSTSR
jgi:hypothetical protein